MLTLRDYQQEVIDKTYIAIRKGFKKILIVAPCGAGKTVIAAKLVSDIVSRNKNPMFVVDQENLIDQTYSKMSQVGVHCGFIKAGYAEDRNAQLQIASRQTLPRRQWWREHDIPVVIIDEAHEVAFSKVMRDLMELHNGIFIGLTATPYRTSSKQNMGDLFEILIAAPVPRQLIEEGFLVPNIYYTVPEADLSNVKLSRGDYDAQQLSIACNKQELIGKAVEYWIKLASDRHATIAFTVDVEHAKNLTAAFRAHNVPSAYITGETPLHERETLYSALKEGVLKVLVSVDVASKGLDVVEVDCVLLCRPSMSKAKIIQQIGRGMRPSPHTNKENCLVLDQAGNISKHGFIEEISRYVLHKTEEKEGDNPAPKKVCPTDDGGCGAFLYGFEMTCRHCGYQFQAREKQQISGNLVRVFATEKQEQDFNKYRDFLRTAYNAGYLPEWADVQLRNTNHGMFPKGFSKEDSAIGAIFGDNPQLIHYRKYFAHLTELANKKNKTKDWIAKQMQLEFGSGWSVELRSANAAWEAGVLVEETNAGVKVEDEFARNWLQLVS